MLLTQRIRRLFARFCRKPNPVAAGRLAGVIPYLAAVVVCAAALTVVLKLWRADFRAPFQDGGDATFSQLFVKNVLDTGWYTTHPRGGAPYGLELYDFPMSEGVHFLFIRGLGLFTANVYRVTNYFYLLGFVLSTLTAMFALRRLGLRAVPALVGGVLFAFLPFHFWRAQGHLFLGAYYMVPLGVLLAAWLAAGRLGGAAADDPWRRRRWATAVLAAAALSSTGAYYAFFGCFFLAVGGVAGFCRTGRVRVLAAAAALIGVVTAGLLANVASAVRYAREHGPNPQVARRVPAEADAYGLNLSQLLLPRDGHRAESVRQAKQEFTASPGRPLPNPFGSGVGAVGLVGLAAAAGAALFRRPRPGESPVLADLGTLALCGALLGTIGGLGSLFAYFVSPKIRCYDRISIYIGFCAVAGAAVVLDRVLARLPVGWPRRAGYAGCAAVLAFGLWDQTSPADVPRYEANRAEYRNLARFVAAMEAAQPPGGMVFQLPFIDFPETPPLANMGEYDHLRLLLHQSSLRFSHGRVRGRPGAGTLAAAGRLPADRLVDYLAIMGFTGIHVDRTGYADRGREVAAQLQAALGTAPLECENGRDLFFPMAAYRERLLAPLSPAEVAGLEAHARYPVSVTWAPPFDAEERSPELRWHWCRGPAAELVIENTGRAAVPATVSFQVRTPTAQSAVLTVSGLVELQTRFSAPTECVARVELPPGRHVLRFECPAEPLKTSCRDIYFGVVNFRLKFDNEHPLLARIKGADGGGY